MSEGCTSNRKGQEQFLAFVLSWSFTLFNTFILDQQDGCWYTYMLYVIHIHVIYLCRNVYIWMKIVTVKKEHGLFTYCLVTYSSYFGCLILFPTEKVLGFVIVNHKISNPRITLLIHTFFIATPNQRSLELDLTEK